MSIIDVLMSAINKLPDILKHDLEFNSLVNIIKNLILNVDEDECYLTLDKDLYNSDVFDDYGYVKNYLSSNLIVSVSFEDKNQFFSFSIYDLKSMGYSVELIKSEYGKGTKSVVVTLIKGIKGSSLRVEQSMYDDSGKCVDYNCDLKYFDTNHKKDKSKDIETLKDEAFSNRFYVPIEMARFLRLNFNRFREQINEMLRKGQAKITEEEVAEQGYLFCSPFRFGEIESYIKNDFLSAFDGEEESETMYQIADGDEDSDDFDPDLDVDEEYLNVIDVDRDKLDFVLKSLSYYIDFQDVIVCSDNIIHDLITYLSNEMIDKFSTNGVIIKKVNEQFILYYISAQSGQIIVYPHMIDKEKLKEMYNQNVLNVNVKGLEEFFEIGLGRK